MEYKISTVMFDGVLAEREIPFFRGAIIELSGYNPLYHNHTEDGRCMMHYPHIQYKILDGKPSIVGIGDGADSLESLFELNSQFQIQIGRCFRDYSVLSKNTYYFAPSESIDEKRRYLIDGWLPFNQSNYTEYNETSSLSERIMQLDSVLKGNILSLYKDFNVFINNQITGNIVNLHEHKASFKRVKMISYDAIIETNVALPEHCGIGKGVSHGFGTIKAIP